MRKALTLAVTALLWTACPTRAQAPAEALLPPTALINNMPQWELSRLWWRWAMSFDDSNSPVADRDGRFCALGQRGSIWFLAGTYGTRRTVRHCRIPAGKTLFFPLINYMVYPAKDRHRSCDSLQSQAAALTDSPSALVLELDGSRLDGLAAHRQAMLTCFQLYGDDDRLAAGNGYYVALKPLKPGRHTLNFGGILPTMMQAVTYTLDVE